MFTQPDTAITHHVLGKGDGHAIGPIEHGQEHDPIWVTAPSANGEVGCAPNPIVRLGCNWTKGRPENPLAAADKAAGQSSAPCGGVVPPPAELAPRAWAGHTAPMHLRLPAIVCAVRQQGETAAIARLLTADHGLIAAYVAGGRGRQLRPVLIPGNLVEAELRSRSGSQMPFGRLELIVSRGPWLGEPLASAAIGWATALTAAALPEGHAYPPLYAALQALLDAVCHAPSARGWTPALVGYEALVLREMGYGAPHGLPDPDDFPANLVMLDRLGRDLARYALADRRSDVMASRTILRERLGKID